MVKVLLIKRNKYLDRYLKNYFEWNFIKSFFSLIGNEAKVYEYIVRHFLACVSKNAEGLETTVNITINDEKVNISKSLIFFFLKILKEKNISSYLRFMLLIIADNY